MQKKQIDIVIPCYNESENIEVIFNAIQSVFKQETLHKYLYNFIFVNDGSVDNTLQILEKLSLREENVKYISFSRNFGHQLAVKAGIDNSTADAVISMDADMQHPPVIIPELIKKWEEGYKVVGTIRSYGDNVSRTKRNSTYFYKLINLISEVEIKNGTADFRLLDREIVEIIRNMQENDPFLRGIIPWLGFEQSYIPYLAEQRHSGTTKYTLKKMLHLALSGITAFSVKPLQFAVYLGFLFSALSLLYIPYVIYAFVSKTEISGWASILMTIVFFGGLQLIILGIIGIYIGKIFKQTKDRPNYIIEKKNF